MTIQRQHFYRVWLLIASLGAYMAAWFCYPTNLFAAPPPPPSLQATLPQYGFHEHSHHVALARLFHQAGIIPPGQTWERVFPMRNQPEALVHDIMYMVTQTQRQFSNRFGTQERWEAKPLEWQHRHAVSIQQDLDTLGFVKSIRNQVNQTDCICIFGSTGPTMANRIAYALRSVQSGLATQCIVLLAGERYLTPHIDGSPAELQALAHDLHVADWHQLTETHLIQTLYQHSPLSQMGFPVHVIDTPRGALPRPTTQTTLLDLVQWLKSHPEIRHMVFVSNQPHVQYQKSIIDFIFEKHGIEIGYEVIGDHAAPNTTPHLLLDGLGAYLWASTPLILEKMQLDPQHPETQSAFESLYSRNPLIYNYYNKPSTF